MTLLNIIGQASTSSGAIGVGATIDLDGAAVTSFNTFAAGGAVDGEPYTVTIKDGSNRQVCRVTYNSGTPDTLTIGKIFASTNGGSAITLSGSAEVYVDAAAEDIGGRVLLGEHTVSTPVGEIVLTDLTWSGYSTIVTEFDRLGMEITDSAQDYLNLQASDDNGLTWATSGYDSVVRQGQYQTFFDGAANFAWLRAGQAVKTITGSITIGSDYVKPNSLNYDFTGTTENMTNYVITGKAALPITNPNAIRIYTATNDLDRGTVRFYGVK